MAGSVAIFGRDLLAITFAQHLLGVGTAIFTYGIGRLAFGRAAGLLAGLAAALSSPLLIYEHYLITESVFTFFLILSMLLLVAGLQDRARGVLRRRRPRPRRGRADPAGRAGRPRGPAPRGDPRLPALAPEPHGLRPGRRLLRAAGRPLGDPQSGRLRHGRRGQHRPIPDLPLGQARAQLRLLRGVRRRLPRRGPAADEGAQDRPGSDRQAPRAGPDLPAHPRQPEPDRGPDRRDAQGHRPRSDHARSDALGHRHGRDVLRAAERRPEGGGGPLAPGGPRAASGGEPVGPLQLPAGGARRPPTSTRLPTPKRLAPSSDRPGWPGGSSGSGSSGRCWRWSCRPTAWASCRSWSPSS